MGSLYLNVDTPYSSRIVCMYCESYYVCENYEACMEDGRSHFQGKTVQDLKEVK